jgi:hypothetical protein
MTKAISFQSWDALILFDSHSFQRCQVNNARPPHKGAMFPSLFVFMRHTWRITNTAAGKVQDGGFIEIATKLVSFNNKKKKKES